MENLSIIILIGVAVIGLIFVMSKNSQPEKKSEPTINQPEKIENVISNSPITVSSTDESEIVAAIIAALAASLNTTSDKLVVRSFRKVSTVSTWNEEARRGI